MRQRVNRYSIILIFVVLCGVPVRVSCPLRLVPYHNTTAHILSGHLVGWLETGVLLDFLFEKGVRFTLSPV